MIRIVQCLCPARHCIAAIAYDPAHKPSTGNSAEASLKILIDIAIAGKIDPWCGICLAPSNTWTYEDAPTKFSTWEEAEPEMKRLEAEQDAVRAHLAAARLRASKN